MSKTLCIYHGNCADGFGAAWVVRKALGAGVEFHPGVYQNAPPDVTDRDVYLVDFSYKLATMREIMEAAQSTFISSTFWTERIGPTAALKTLEVMQREQSWDTITQTGLKIRERWQQLTKAEVA